MATDPLLTDDELLALDLISQFSVVCRRIIGITDDACGPNAQADWAEMAQRIHAIQHTIGAQAAARAYPESFRLLGECVSAPAG